MIDLFHEYYYNDENILNGPQLWKEIQKDEKFNKDTMKRKDFDKWLNEQEQQQIQKVKYKVPKYYTHPIIAKPHSFQTDLMFLTDLHKLNHGFDSIINFIEITSKKAYSYALKKKTADEVLEAFKTFLSDVDDKIDFLEIDKGSEFSKVINYCKDSTDIKVIIFNGDKNSMSVVERFNRTLRNYISKKCPNGVWYLKFKKIVNAYNKKVHSSTGYSPNDLNENEKAQDEIRQKLIGLSILPALELKKFNIGDSVRVYKKRSLFGKGGGNFSKTIHKITDIKMNSIFLDDDDTKKYRYYNLLKVDKVENNDVYNNEQIKLRDKAKENYKIAKKLAKEQIIRKPVKETEEFLKSNLEDETLGRGKRIKKANSKYL